MSMNSKRINGSIKRDALLLHDESNPNSSPADVLYLSTTLDQVFDDEDPTKKNLRKILDELHTEILTGGRGNIEFPVTSVNGQTGDVMLDKKHLNLNNVDNTSDIDKPLSVPQKTAVLEILSKYNFNVNLSDLYDHIADNDNPHQISIEQLDADGKLNTMISELIYKHNIGTSQSIHPDIRSRLSSLWTRVDTLENGLEDRLRNTLKSLEEHLSNSDAHHEVMVGKEDVSHKVEHMIDDCINYVSYPSTRAVVEYTMSCLTEFRNTLPDVKNWIDSIHSVDSRSELPVPTSRHYRTAYFIRKGESSRAEIAICQKASNSVYTWEFHDLGAYSKFSDDHFVDTPDGIDINMKSIVSEILEHEGVFQEVVANNYYNKDQIDAMHLVDAISIIPGTQNGTIRYYINDDPSTMSDDVKVPGLQRLAYLEWVTEHELRDNAVRSKHIINGAIEARHLQERIIDLNQFKCGTYGTVLGNTTQSGRREIHEIKLMELADYLRPLIGGWPDPTVPGGNPWNDIIMNQLPHPHLMRVGIEHPLGDKSYIIRYTGEISILPNMRSRVELSTTIKNGEYRLIEAGGSWCYQSNPSEWTTLGGSNITGSTSFSSNTFSSICMTEEGIYFDSISVGDRMKAEYDVWVRYFKPDELIEGTYNPI